ncbi:hypothetical protein BGX27_003329 [Mortierella sp. AM989]|nr:hypothetical protein BGX27_003329 [Mortierella sp. AM989]
MDSSNNKNVTSMASLPPECLEMIIAFLRHDLASLHRLLFVSRQFFQLTVPVLYRSPFRLAAGIPDPPPVSIYFASSTTVPLYRSTIGPSYDSSRGWTRFLERTKLLTRLMIQNLQINHLGQIPRITAQNAAISDDFSGLENLEPLLPLVISPSQPNQPPAINMPNDWAIYEGNGSGASINAGPEEQEEWGTIQQEWSEDQHGGWNDTSQQGHSGGHCPDLISFEDEWGESSMDTTKRVVPTIDNVYSSKERNETSCRNNIQKSSGTGLLMDYFYFYTHQDHRSIASVIREIYPGAGRREYDKYIADIEQAILMHNPRQIEMIHVQSPSLVIPLLHENLEKFERLSAMEFFDSVWKVQELEMVYRFLMDHTALFSQSAQSLGRNDHVSQPSTAQFDPYMDRMNGLHLSRGTTRHRCSPIRHLKYSTSRGQWDDATLAGQLFDPVQLMKALEPGLQTIDSMYWPRTRFPDLETLDVNSLRSLKIGSLVTPQEDLSFSRPEFLSRCRRLENLETFSSSKDMFGWAAKEWNMNRRNRKVVSVAGNSNNSNSNKNHDPWTSNVTGTIAEKPLVRLRSLRIHGPTDRIVYEILRDAFYGFRETLQLLEVRSDMESIEGEAEWMDHAHDLLMGRRQHVASARIVGGKVENRGANRSGKPEFDEEEYYNSLSSISSRSLYIRWEVPRLSLLDLTGPIALAFDIGSLQFMPSLHTACFAITTEPSPWVARGKSHGDMGMGSFGEKKRDMTHLPLVASRTLRRVLIRGPWPEITDRNLQAMIETITVNSSNLDGLKTHYHNHDNGSDDDDDDGRWGNQLLELSVLDNARVTVPGMIRLARQMDRLQVMGTSLNLLSSYASDSTSFLSMAYTSEEILDEKYLHHTRPSHEPCRTSDLNMKARDLILKAQIDMPWVDLGPDASHLARRNKRDGYLSRGWGI